MAAPGAAEVRDLVLSLQPDSLSLRLGAREEAFPLGLPVLAANEEAWHFSLPGAQVAREGDLTRLRSEHQEVGIYCEEAHFPLEEQTLHAYRQILDLPSQGRHLHRIWNFVPAINADTAELENYRSFCIGRSRAFEANYGTVSTFRMPAASAVGNRNNRLTIVFLCGPQRPDHLENPHQVPAYHYPEEHGPRSPSFARATVTGRQAFISGTASIHGHTTIGVGDLEQQLIVTANNLDEMAQRIGATGFPLAEAQRHAAVYIRHREHLGAVRHFLQSRVFTAGDRVAYLEAEVCRRELLVEVEVSYSLYGR